MISPYLSGRYPTLADHVGRRVAARLTNPIGGLMPIASWRGRSAERLLRGIVLAPLAGMGRRPVRQSFACSEPRYPQSDHMRLGTSGVYQPNGGGI